MDILHASNMDMHRYACTVRVTGRQEIWNSVVLRESSFNMSMGLIKILKGGSKIFTHPERALKKLGRVPTICILQNQQEEGLLKNWTTSEGGCENFKLRVSISSSPPCHIKWTFPNWLNSCPKGRAYFLSVPTGKISSTAYTQNTIKKY